MITTLSNKLLTAKISSKGAELFSLQNNSNREYIWNGNPNFWGKHSPVLFPIVGTLKNNRYCFEGVTYQLARHGFARDFEFEIVHQSSSEVVFSLQSNTQTKQVYPFDFELQISYSLKENELEIGYKIFNNDNVIMPFSIGGHPAFALPLDFENYTLVFEKEEILMSFPLENDLLSATSFEIPTNEKRLPLTYSLFEKDALIFKQLNSKSIAIEENGIPIVYFKFKDFPNFGIWTKDKAPFICLEPWLGYSDTINTKGNIIEKEGIQLLHTKETFACSFGIVII